MASNNKRVSDLLATSVCDLPFRTLTLTICDTSERTLAELRIARAYIRLSSLPEDSPEASVSLASIGSGEIRMLRGPKICLDGVPLFWLELFDHSAKTSVDSF